MHPLEKKIKKLLSEKKIISQGEKLLVGVSGGADSLCLLHILNSLAADFPFSLAVAYFDHCLRPEETALEVEFVANQARGMGWPFYHGSGNVAGFAGENGLSIEAAARTLRYDYFGDVLADSGCRKIAVAHTADDQAEELLLRLLRGTGRKGLAGMEFVRDSLIVRPLLQTTKDEVLDYLKAKEIKFCTDSSNQQIIYLRNRVRLDLIPYIEDKFNPGIRKILRQTSSILQEEESLLNKISSDAYTIAVLEKDPLKLDLSFFVNQPVAIQRRIIEKILLKLGNSPGFRQIDHILNLAGQGESGRHIHLSCGLRGLIEGNKFIFSYPQGRVHTRGNLSGAGDDLVFDVDITEPGVFELDENRQVEVACLDYIPDKAELCANESDFFDLEEMSFPFKIRNRHLGDRFRPLGSTGHKKVGDFLTEIKLAENERRLVPVLECGGEIAALLGVRISHRFRVRNSSSRVLRATVMEKD